MYFAARPNVPEPPGNASVSGRVFIRIQTNCKPELLGASSEQFVHWPPEQMFAGAIQQTQNAESGSKVNTATSISAMIVRSSAVASKRQGAAHAAVSPSKINFEECLAQRIIFASTARAN